MDPCTRSWVDQHATWMRNTVHRLGWAIQYVAGEECSRPGCDCPPGDGPPFVYTVGLFGLGHPELLILGAPPETAAAVLNDLGERVRAGEALLPGQLITFHDWPHRIIPESVPNPGDIVFSANDFYRQPDKHSVPVLQLTYDDTEGRFPWDDGYAAPEMQPRPGTFNAGRVRTPCDAAPAKGHRVICR